MIQTIKKLTPVSFLISGLGFLILPIISFAEGKALEYVPLESEALGGVITKDTTLSGFLTQLFSLGLAVCAALAVIMIVWGGVQIMLTDSVFSKDEGKTRIKNAIYGLLLALFSWLILYIINPSILDWSMFDIAPK